MAAVGSRRAVLLGLVAGLGGAGLLGCADDRVTGAPSAAGGLTFRPGDPVDVVRRTGFFTIKGLGGSEPPQVYVPTTRADTPLRLVVMLHGANGHPPRALRLLREHADDAGLVLVAPKSQSRTWDVIQGGFGPDVDHLDRLLELVAALCPIASYAIGGFSDGASYALSLGLTNGDLFDSVIAFSPGFEAAEEARGRPRLFVSHGTDDPVLPIDRCSRRIVPALEDEGYDVTYEEFAGEHEIPPEIRDRAAEWLADVSN